MDHAPKLHVVTGKGGVGKTSVACALAVAYAQAGQRTLLCEVHGGDRVADALGVAPVGYAMREVRPKLWAIDLTPEASLREYVLLTIKVQAIYRAIFEGRLVASFLRLLPALGELTMLGKVWYEYTHAQRHGAPRFDVIILDAPATGHARALLLAPQAVMASVPTGPMRDNAQRIDAMLRAPTSELNVVTTAEDMPIAEAEELLAFAAQQNFLRCGVVQNQVPTPLPADVQALAATWAGRPGDAGDAALAGAGQSLLRRAERAERGAAALARLRHVPTVHLPSYPLQQDPAALIAAMAQSFAATVACPRADHALGQAAPARVGAA